MIRIPSRFHRPLLAGVAVAALAGSLAGCALLVGGAAVGTAVMASDRRTSGAQVEDQTVELKAGPRIREAIGERAHINVTSYNRTVLLTGEVPTEADKAAAEAAVSRMENVRATVNELVVGANSSLVDRSNDALITSKVKASLVDARDVFASAHKVVTERAVVYLLGRVTEREANRVVSIARGVSGVAKVVKVYEIISEDELAQIRTEPAKPAASEPAR